MREAPSPPEAEHPPAAVMDIGGCEALRVAQSSPEAEPYLPAAAEGFGGCEAPEADKLTPAAVVGFEGSEPLREAQPSSEAEPHPHAPAILGIGGAVPHQIKGTDESDSHRRWVISFIDPDVVPQAFRPGFLYLHLGSRWATADFWVFAGRDDDEDEVVSNSPSPIELAGSTKQSMPMLIAPRNGLTVDFHMVKPKPAAIISQAASKASANQEENLKISFALSCPVHRGGPVETGNNLWLCANTHRASLLLDLQHAHQWLISLVTDPYSGDGSMVLFLMFFFPCWNLEDCFLRPTWMSEPICDVFVAFPKLEWFFIKDMPNWEEWSFLKEVGNVVDEGEDGDGEICNGDAQSTRLQLLPRLVKLKVEGCPKLSVLPRQLGDDTTSLKELLLIGANNLKAVEDLSMLELLVIEDCEGLEKVSNLPQVLKLQVRGCSNLSHVEGLGNLQQLGLGEDMQEISSRWVRELQNQHQRLHGEDLDVYTLSTC
ncbi:hypothetical protein ZWY2020_031932 [Hordeum vulgare]|nr:hypothetical protein ZWY2020_031932 [Hordeum vulgare]